MLELTKFPDRILTCHSGQQFLVNGKVFVFNEDYMGSKCYLTSDEEDENGDTYPWKHVRNENGVALMTREELISVLEYGTFTIY